MQGLRCSLLLFLVAGFPMRAQAEPKTTPLTLTPASFEETLTSLVGADGRLPAGTHLRLQPGHYELQPSTDIDSTCGNCEDPRASVDVTVGLRLSGTRIVLEGTSPDSVVLHTRAGYGIWFDRCDDCRIANLTLTDGVRDFDGRATDAAVVVRYGAVRVEGCRIRDNIGDFSTVTQTVVGIIGIAGREGARIHASGNTIRRNSWDGIALYRGAEGVLEDNVIDGVDKAHGKEVGGGRGVGIGLTWDARATVRRNRVTRYWKGIGVFVDARGDVQDNIVEDILTWGLAYWDGGSGKPVAYFETNLVYQTGACGISIARDRAPDPDAGDAVPGSCRGNIVVRSGQNPKYDDGETYCAQCPIAVASAPPGFDIDANALYLNRWPQGTPPADQPPGEFARLAGPVVARLGAIPHFGASPALAALRQMVLEEAHGAH